MDFGFTEEQEKLRQEVREFYLNEMPEDYVSYGPMTGISEGQQAFWLALQKKAAAKGYLTAGWPKEYGGSGLGQIEQGIVEEEQWYAGVLWPNHIGYMLAAPAVLLFGTEEQKKRFIPPITRGEVVWFEAFTEPNAGSDEANIQTRAVRDGDDYVINGQKVFISGTHKPNYLYTLVRTADTVPKHRGLSLFLIPADTPGITFRPLPTMGFGTQNEVFFDDVRVSKEYLLGEINKGFYHAMATFEFERTGTGGAMGEKRTLEEFVQFCKEEKRNGKPLIDDPEVGKTIAELVVQTEVRRLIAWHTAWWFGQRKKLGPKPFDLTGFFGKSQTEWRIKAMMDIMGLYGQLCRGSKWAKFAGRLERTWQVARSTHAAGTFEIYKVILAQRGLGLPRIPAKLNPVITKALQERG